MLAASLKALGDPSRLRAFAAIEQYGELCACQVTALLGLTGATVSRHLSQLLSVRLVVSRKEGRWVYYSLSNEARRSKLLREVIREAASTDWRRRDKQRLEKIMAQSREDICRAQRGEKCCPGR